MGVHDSQRWVGLLQQAVQQARPVRSQLFVEERLRAAPILDPGKTVIPPLVAHADAVHLSRQPLPTIHAHMNGKREPGLQTHIDQADVRVIEVMVVVQALAWFATQFEFLLRAVGTYFVRPATLNTLEDADQPLVNAVPLGDFPSPGFLVHVTVVQVLHRAPLAGSHFLCCLAHLSGDVAGKRLEVTGASGSRPPRTAPCQDRHAFSRCTYSNFCGCGSAALGNPCNPWCAIEHSLRVATSIMARACEICNEHSRYYLMFGVPTNNLSCAIATPSFD